MIALPKHYLTIEGSDDLQVFSHENNYVVSIGNNHTNQDKEVVSTHDGFIYVVSGEFIMHASKMEDIVLKAGQGLYFGKGHVAITERPAQTGEFRMFILFFSDDLLHRVARRIVPNTVTSPPMEERYRYFDGRGLAWTRAYFETLNLYFQPGAHLPSELVSLKLAEVIWLLFRESPEFHRMLAPYLHPTRPDLAVFMQQHYCDPLSIEELARLAGRSLSTFKREFELLYKEPPKRWVNRQRLHRARNLLRNTNLTVAEVSYQVGYDNVSYFTQLFRKQFAKTPTDDRKHPVAAGVANNNLQGEAPEAQVANPS